MCVCVRGGGYANKKQVTQNVEATISLRFPCSENYLFTWNYCGQFPYIKCQICVKEFNVNNGFLYQIHIILAYQKNKLKFSNC